MNKALRKADLCISDIDLIEIQEAFASQVPADANLMGITNDDLEAKVNVNGSGISLGHPIAATGAMRIAWIYGYFRMPAPSRLAGQASQHLKLPTCFCANAEKKQCFERGI